MMKGYFGFCVDIGFDYPARGVYLVVRTSKVITPSIKVEGPN